MRIIRKNLNVLILIVSLLLTNFAMAQQTVLTGKVTDSSSGEALPGVSIVVKGTTNGTITNFDGVYTLNVNKGNVILFSFVGYKTQEIAIDGQKNLNVALAIDDEELEEVVVIGYGQVKKGDATGSVTAVSADDFNKGAIASPEELVMGKIAGVQITTGGGAPGSGSTIRIRGGSSLSASNDPLFVIDGVPVDNDAVSGMRNPLSTINPNDIETFTILKDASATAIYGSRASNGVVIITTKKGKNGAPTKVTYDGKFSVGTRPGEIDVLSTEEYTALINERYKGQTDVLKLLGKTSTDWQSQIFQTAIGHEHNVGLTGSYRNIPYRVSVGYTKQDGLLKTTTMDRFTGSIGINPTFFENHLKVDINLKGMAIKNVFADEGSIGNAIGFDPTQEVYATNKYGNYFTWLQSDGNPLTVATTNPIAQLELREDKADVQRILGNIQFDYKFHFLPELRAVLNLGYDKSKSDGTVYVPSNAAWMYDVTNGGGENRVYTQDKKNELLDFYLNYTRNLSFLDSKVDLMGGYSWQHFYRENYVFSQSAVKGTNGSFKQLTAENYDPTEYYLVSFFGRLNYSIKDRYLLTATLRNDGTSRFSENTRWGLFPALAFAWQIKNESFMQSVKAVSDLKLRLGYGITGQQNIGQGDYPYLARYSYSKDNARVLFGDKWINTLRPDGYDSNIKWEETTTYNVGIDYGFLKNRITGSFEVYQRDTKDLLNVVPVPAGTNFINEILTNVGDLTNKGFEFTINGKIISQKDLSWDLGFNLTRNKNEITKLTASEDPNYLGVETGGIAGGVGNKIQIHSVGHPASSYFVYEQVYDENKMPIEGLYVDRNGDGQITTKDKYYYKTPVPDVFMGFNSAVVYKNWDLSLAGRISINNYVYNNVDSRNSAGIEIYWPSGYMRNVTQDFFNTRFEKVQYWSDYYIQNASFLRLDNVSLGYNFKNLMNNKLDLRLYSTVQNVLVITNYKGLDPEVSGGIDNNVYPRPRTFMLGVSVGF
jgi:iron complex outermembrane receptor protein